MSKSNKRESTTGSILKDKESLEKFNEQLKHYSEIPEGEKVQILDKISLELEYHRAQMDISISSLGLENKNLKLNLLLGPTGSGKSTLLNYLSGIKMKAETGEYNKTVLRVADGEQSIAEIGEGMRSSTIVPNFYQIDNVLYADCPGDYDNRGIMNVLINSNLRHYLIEKASEIGFTLVVPYKALFERSEGFVSIIKGFAGFVGQLGENVSESISLVFTKAPDKSNTNDIVIRRLQKEILDKGILEKGKSEDIIEKVIKNGTVSVFVKPAKGDPSPVKPYSPQYSTRENIIKSIHTSPLPDVSSSFYGNLSAEDSQISKTVKAIFQDLVKNFENKLFETVVPQLKLELIKNIINDKEFSKEQIKAIVDQTRSELLEKNEPIKHSQNMLFKMLEVDDRSEILGRADLTLLSVEKEVLLVKEEFKSLLESIKEKMLDSVSDSIMSQLLLNCKDGNTSGNLSFGSLRKGYIDAIKNAQGLEGLYESLVLLPPGYYNEAVAKVEQFLREIGASNTTDDNSKFAKNIISEHIFSKIQKELASNIMVPVLGEEYKQLIKDLQHILERELPELFTQHFINSLDEGKSIDELDKLYSELLEGKNKESQTIHSICESLGAKVSNKYTLSLDSWDYYRKEHLADHIFKEKTLPSGMFVSIKQKVQESLASVKNSYLGRSAVPKVSSVSKEGVIKITGFIIKSSDIIREVKASEEKVNSVSAIASHKVVIDENIVDENFRGVNLSIIAPTWQVNGQRVIKLSGRDGEEHLKAAEEQAKASEGHPGQPGGNFFGIGKYGDLKNLTIESNGGRGGKGQQGSQAKESAGKGNPMPVQDVEKAVFSSYSRSYALDLYDKDNYHFHFAEFTHNDSAKTAGQKGSMGLPGGIGGKGGSGGQITLSPKLINKEENIPKVINENGDSGAGGDGGIGGRGQQHGDNIVVEAYVHSKGTDSTASRVKFQNCLEGNTLYKFLCRYYNNKDEYKSSSASMATHDLDPAVPINKAIERGQYDKSKRYDTEATKKYIIDFQPGFVGGAYEGVALLWYYDSSNQYGPQGDTGPNGIENKEINSKLPENYSVILNDAKDFYIKAHLNDKKFGSFASKFKSHLDDIDYHHKYYKITDLINELSLLQRYIVPATNLNADSSDIILSHFVSFKENISLIIKCLTDNKLIEQSRVIQVLDKHVTSLIFHLKPLFQKQLVVNMQGYLKLVQENIAELNIAQEAVIKRKRLEECEGRYKTQINTKIIQAKHVVDLLSKEVPNITGLLDDNISGILDHIVELQKEANIQEAQLIVYREKLANYIAMKTIFGICDILCSALGFFGPEGEIIGKVCGAGLDIAKQIADQNMGDNVLHVPLEIDAAINTSIESQQLSSQRQILKIQEDQLNKQRSSQLAQETIIERERTVTDTAPDGSQRTCSVTERVSHVNTVEVEQQSALQDQKDIVSIQKKNLASQEGARKAQTFVKVVAGGVKIFNDLQDGNKKLQEVDKAINSVKNTLNSIEQNKGKIEDYLSNFSLKLKGTNLTKAMEGKSSASLDLYKWQIKQYLEDVKGNIIQIARQIKFDEKISATIDKFTSLIETMVNIFDGMQKYKESEDLAIYMADLMKSSVGFARKYQNTDIQKAMDNLELGIKKSFALISKQEVTNIFKHTIFPFAARHPELIHEAVDFTYEESGADAIPVGEMYTYIKSLNEKLEKDSYSINEKDACTMQAPDRTLYKWYGKSYPNEIRKLLLGESITLAAPLDSSELLGSAIKANKFQLRLRGDKDDQLTQELKDAVVSYSIRLEHSGQSFYKFDSKTYKMAHEAIKLLFSFPPDKEENYAYIKLNENKPIISPYTTWGITLKPRTANKVLEKFKDSVESIVLELIGSVTYVDEQEMNSSFKENLNLDKYYNQYKEHETAILGSDNEKIYADVSSDLSDSDFLFTNY